MDWESNFRNAIR